MTAQEWLETFAKGIGMDPPTPDEIDRLLKLAAAAAHGSERIAAPIACYLAGRAGLDLDAAITQAEAITE